MAISVPGDEREAEGWREAELYADDHEPSRRAETADDFMAGWRAADRMRQTQQNGSCWTRGPDYIAPPGHCVPMPPICELPAGHLGAHRSGSAEWGTVQRYEAPMSDPQRRNGE